MSIETEYRVANVSDLNVRSGPSTSNASIGKLNKGDKVEVIPNVDGWVAVNYNGAVGYVYATYLSDKTSNTSSSTTESVVSTVKKYVNTETLNFRNGPSTSNQIIGKLSKNTEVEVISEGNGWSKIKYNGTTGYVSTIYLNEKVTDISNTTNTSSLSDKIIAYAKTLLGKPYVWADEGPNSFDCSGFTWYVFKNIAKITLPRVSSAQGTYGTYVEMKNLIPADLIFFDTVGAYDKKITHVGIYIGSNQFIHASSSQGKVVISQLSGTYYERVFVNGRRVLK